MAIPINELKVNDILFSNKRDKECCIIKKIHEQFVEVEFINRSTGNKEEGIVLIKELEPIMLLDNALCLFGFKKTINSFFGCPDIKCYSLKRDYEEDIIVIYTNGWHQLFLINKTYQLGKDILYLHTIQNLLSTGKESADEVSDDKLFELTNPYCVLPFEPKK